MKKLAFILESQAFGVCNRLGEKMNIAPSAIRKFFIYSSFLTMGSPLIVYLGLAWLMDIRKHLRKGSEIWDN